MITDELKEYTASLHCTLESAPLSTQLLAPAFNAPATKSFLQCSNIAIKQWTKHCFDFGAPAIDFHRLALGDLLAISHDLDVLGGPAQTIATTFHFGSTVESLIGHGYVFEGARLGGVMIHRSLLKSSQGKFESQFFCNDGSTVKRRWAEFCASADAIARATLDREAIFHASSQTFKDFYALLMSNYDDTERSRD